MKVKDIKSLYLKESENNSIEMSDRLKNTPIKTASDDFFDSVERVSDGGALVMNNKRARAKTLVPIIAAFFLIIGIILAVINPFAVSGTNLTAYILEINPTICITANAEEEIVGVYSLNEDGDTVLSADELSDIVGKKLEQGVGSIIKVVINEGFFENYDKPFGIYALNDNRNTENQKLKNFSEMVDKNLKDNGMGNIRFEQREMTLSDFKGRMNMEGDFRRLDDMFDEMKKKDRFFNEQPVLPPPPIDPAPAE